MEKNTYYFSHDYSARNDPKIKKLIHKHGYLGYGIYWAIIEDLYMNNNELQLDCECIAFDLHTSENLIHSIIFDFDLFVVNDDKFYSNSVKNRLEKRNEKSEKARLSAEKRWENAKLMRTHNEPNAIKERKGKEIKGNNIITISKDIEPIKKKHSFEKSEFFDKQKFKAKFPDWPDDKLKHYYESAKLYSESKGAKYLNWASAIKNWDNKNPYNPLKTKNHESTKSELAESIAERERRITTILTDKSN